MKNSSDFTITEIEKMISISNLMGIEVPEEKSASVELYLDAILAQLQKIPYTPFPVSFHTVDVIPFAIDSLNGSLHVLLGRKHDMTLFQILGGFMNPGETADIAAEREVKEESNLDCIHELDYIGSYFINDPRFGDSCHKITTSFFAYFVRPGEIHDVKGMDDIAEVKWIGMDTLLLDYKTIIAPLHHHLFTAFVEWTHKIKIYG